MDGTSISHDRACAALVEAGLWDEVSDRLDDPAAYPCPWSAIWLTSRRPYPLRRVARRGDLGR